MSWIGTGGHLGVNRKIMIAYRGKQRLYMSLITRSLSGFLLHVNTPSYNSPLTALARLIHSIVTEGSL